MSEIPERKDKSMNYGIIAGMLSSSCCVLQICLNILSFFNLIHVGCVGFNKWLGPTRPFFRTLTYCWLCICWFLTPQKLQSRRRMARTTFLTLIMLFLPEILQMWDSFHPVYRLKSFLHQVNASKETVQWKEEEFWVNKMGCEGCQSAVQSILESSTGIEMAKVDWRSGKVKVFGPAVDSLDLHSLAQLLESHGYELDTDKTRQVKEFWLYDIPGERSML
jgi:copper chaperone CopZ